MSLVKEFCFEKHPSYELLCLIKQWVIDEYRCNKVHHDEHLGILRVFFKDDRYISLIGHSIEHYSLFIRHSNLSRSNEWVYVNMSNPNSFKILKRELDSVMANIVH